MYTCLAMALTVTLTVSSGPAKKDLFTLFTTTKIHISSRDEIPILMLPDVFFVRMFV